MKIMMSKFAVFCYFFAVAFIVIWIWASTSEYPTKNDATSKLPLDFSVPLLLSPSIALTMYISFQIMESLRKKKNLKLFSFPIITAYALAVSVLPFVYMFGFIVGGTYGAGGGAAVLSGLSWIFEWLNPDMAAIIISDFGKEIALLIGATLGISIVSLALLLPILFFGYFVGKGIVLLGERAIVMSNFTHSRALVFILQIAFLGTIFGVYVFFLSKFTW